MAVERVGRVLVVTNDFPPRRGGIESFVLALSSRLPRGGVVVYTARMPGSADLDDALPFPVIRDRRSTLLPTRRATRAVLSTAREHGCDRVLFGAAAPLGLMASGCRRAGLAPLVGLTHGHEVWWARTPVARRLLRRIGAETDVLTYVSAYCRDRISTALNGRAAEAMVRLSPGVDTELFRPDRDGSAVRDRLGIAPGVPVVLAASRLVRRKGHDTLLAGWPSVLAAHPSAVLLVVGDGPDRDRLHKLTADAGLGHAVRFDHSVHWEQMPDVYAAADVFAQPCRTRLRGLEPEALGIVFLEAAASGLPVVVGDSGGARETVIDGETGFLVDPRDALGVADRINALLDDPERAAELGRRGRVFVGERFSWERAVSQLRTVLDLPPDRSSDAGHS